MYGIVFDWFGVLCHGSLGYLREQTPPDRLQELDDLSKRYDRGYMISDEYLKHVGTLIQCSQEEVRHICQQQYILNHDMITFVRQSRSIYKTALLSNVGLGVLESILDSSELDELFDVRILSGDVGIMKPDPRMYELVAKELDLAPEECVMIDDLEVNVHGAIDVGMQGILYHSVDQTLRDFTILKETCNA